MPRRIIIIGGPRVGKSTLSEKLRDALGIETLRRSHDVEHLGWSESSEFASRWFDDQGDWIIEGVQMARALRKWLAANPDKQLDADILTLHRPFEIRLPGQVSMTKGVFTVLREIQGELIKRGARVHKLKDPNDAIGILKSQDLGEAESQQQRKPMLIEYTKEQFDALPAAQQKLCAEKDGKYTFEFETPSDVAGLKQNRDRVLADLKKAKEDLAAYNGIDPKRHAELVEAHEAAERAALEGKGQWQVLEQQLKDQHAQQVKQITDKHAEEKKALQDEIGGLTGALEENLIDAGLTLALSKHTKAVELLMPHARKHAKMFKGDDGKYTGKIIDKDGNPRIGDAQGKPMTFDQLVEEMKASETYLRAFDANPNGGGGANGGGNGLALGADLSKLSPTERLKVANRVPAAT